MIEKICLACNKPKRVTKRKVQTNCRCDDTHCKICDSLAHESNACPEKPKEQFDNKRWQNIKTNGKYAKKWRATRKKWFEDNPQDWYVCYICHKSLMPNETTLDHVIPRSRRPDLRYEFSNLQPCCWTCNTEKGSKHLSKV